ncbi:hypothetical protein [Hyphomonas sp. CY54-11-8]|uniref:hypothetical protein n=1 Tax=Hyphomonas sp. CY54-11-8 TaxID=1280944 RepID=UPI00045914D5|nr:hypothetical protein [Hyphomonas sp. CY54-11-8]KCZ47563.1 terminase [Hyphomonas sp. CY54-11-8]
MPAARKLTQAEFDAALVEDIGGFAGDPHRFCMYAFPWGEEGTPLANVDAPYEWQRDLMNDIRDGLVTVEQAIQIATASGHGIGKSACVAMIVCWAMATMPHTRGVITAGTENQLRTKTQPEIAKWFRMMICAHWFECTATKIFARQHPTSWRIDFIPWSENNPEAFAGLHNKGRRILVIIDEASQVADIIWETIRGALTDEDTEIIFLTFGNPTRNSGEFRMCFGRNRHRWVTRQIDSRSVPGTNKDLFEGWVEDYGEDSDFVRVRVRGVFPRAGSMQLIPSDVVAEARQRDAEALVTDPVVIGVDVARFGDDQSVIALRQGRDGKSRPWKRFRGIDTMTLASEVHAQAWQYRADAIFVDGGGMGAGVVDRLEQLNLPPGCQLFEVNFGGSAMTSGRIQDAGAKCANKSTQMWWDMGQWCQRGALPDEQEIEDDLCGREYGYNAANEIQVEKKSDMKKRGLASPDNGDALALTFALPVAPKAMQAQQYEISNMRSDESRNEATGY